MTPSAAWVWMVAYLLAFWIAIANLIGALT